MSSGRHDESSRCEEEVAAMTAAAMLLPESGIGYNVRQRRLIFLPVSRLKNL